MKFIALASIFAFMTSIWVISTASSFDDHTTFVMFVAMISLSVLITVGIIVCTKWSFETSNNYFGGKDDDDSKRS